VLPFDLDLDRSERSQRQASDQALAITETRHSK
jgi:hypothetical protein